MPPEDNLTSSFIPLPTHTMHLFGVFDGEQGGGTSSFLSSTLLIALAGSMIDLLKKHGYGSFGDSDEAESEVYLSSGDGTRTTSDMAPIPFTPDIVRPIPDDSTVEELIRSTFLLVDDWLVVESASAFLSTVDARRAEALSKAQTSSSGHEASMVAPPLTDGLGFKEESTHTLRDGQSGSSALVGYYESDTKKVRIALVGDSRAVLGRPVVNRQYRATPNPRSSVASVAASTSPSSTLVTREEPTAIVDPSKPSTPPNAWWPFSSSQNSTSQNEEKFLEPLKKTEYPTLYEAQVMTEEHTPANPKERARIVAEHPSCHQHLFSRNDDPYSTHPNDERYLGIPTTRGFGYGALKWGRDVQERLHREFLGDQPLKEFSEGRVPWPEGARKESEDSGADSSSSSSLSHTMSTPQVSTPGDPTYLRALPTVTTLPVKPGDFVVLGSKGLWECLSSDEVVGLVGAWVEERRRAMGSKTSATPEPGAASLVRELTSQSPSSISRKLTSIRDPASLMGFNSDGADSSAVLGTNLALPLRGGAPKTNRLVNPTELPVVKESGWSPRSGVAANDGWRWTRSWRVSKDKVKYIVDGRDLECVSVHILRNALGGADKDLRGGLLGMASPRAARFRDDISVQVIFFE
ncbi:phophatase 2C family protein [Coprinopsis cinerea AmutBmut pab1-1]|nr:phophatase 2C family protein [Coprinopsis cinerea AmutBmut pab1-1]